MEVTILAEVYDTVVILAEPEPAVEIVVAENGTVVRQLGGVSITDLPLVVQANGQTQFNIFNLPPERHFLLINGLEHYAPDHYTIEQQGGNVRLVWGGAHVLTTAMKLIFRTFN